MLQVNNLVGFGVGGGGGGVTTLTLADSIGATTSTVSLTGLDIQAGDLLIGCGAGNSGSEVSNSGWDSIIYTSNGGWPNVMQARIADGTETGSIGFVTSSGDLTTGVIVLRPDAAITTITAQDTDGQLTGGNPSPQVKNVGSYTAPMLVIGNYASSRDISPRTFTGMTADEEVELATGIQNSWMKWRLVLESDTPSNITIDMDDEQSNWLMSAIFELS